MPAVTLQPAAGAQGEFTGVLIMRAYHKSTRRHQAQQDPHPRFGARHQPGLGRHDGHAASCSIPSDARGNVDLEALEAACDDTVVGMMLTNPNTLGLVR